MGVQGGDASKAGIKLQYVSATGDACPAGSYTAKLSDDGALFSVQFAKFRPVITPATRSAALSCRLAIVVSAPVGTSYQVDQFTYGGYAYLEQGVKADLTTTYYFQADQSRAEQLHTSLTGPQDRTYIIEDKSSDTGLWSPCGTTTSQTLNVQLHVGLTNSTPTRDGTFEVNEAVGIALRWKKCDVPRAPTSSDADRDSDEDRSSDEDRNSDEDDWSDEDWSSDEWWNDDDDDDWW